MQDTLKKNDELEIIIDRLGVNGEGIAVHNGKVIFVPFALPEEKVKIHIINDKNSFLIAKLLEISQKSNDRCEVSCPYFKKCGGCDIQHLKYEEQLKSIWERMIDLGPVNEKNYRCYFHSSAYHDNKLYLGETDGFTPSVHIIDLKSV